MWPSGVQKAASSSSSRDGREKFPQPTASRRSTARLVAWKHQPPRAVPNPTAPQAGRRLGGPQGCRCTWTSRPSWTCSALRARPGSRSPGRPTGTARRHGAIRSARNGWESGAGALGVRGCGRCRCWLAAIPDAPWRAWLRAWLAPRSTPALPRPRHLDHLGSYRGMDWLEMLLPCVKWLRGYDLRQHLLVGVARSCDLSHAPAGAGA